MSGNIALGSSLEHQSGNRSGLTGYNVGTLLGFDSEAFPGHDAFLARAAAAVAAVVAAAGRS